MAGLDVLIITALPEELEAAKAAGQAGVGNSPGVQAWEPKDEGTATPYDLGRYRMAGGASITVALARPTRMGATSTSPVTSLLAERLQPRCLAMCGVCAGNPKDVTLGDVVVAELAYRYSEGKSTADGFQADQRQIKMRDTWIRAAQGLSTKDLPSFGALTDHEKQLWLLERLLEDVDPRRHPASSRYFNNESWAAILESLKHQKLISRTGVPPTLTSKGRQYVTQQLYYDLEGPRVLPFEVTVAPMASGDVAVKDGITWDSLKSQGVRTVIGLEMEAATIATVADTLQVPDWVVIKGVMDYADPRKDDRYKKFAARSSAEVLFKFLSLQLTERSTSSVTSTAKSIYVIGGVTDETPYPQFENTEVGDVCRQMGDAIARAGADLVVCSPFPDSADHHAVLGYVRSGVGRTVHFHRPRAALVEQRQAELLAMLGDTSVRFVSWDYPGPEGDDAWGQAWMLCQLMALERADVVISIGGRASKSASTLLHLADARRKPVVPFAFLGGASARIFKQRDWGALYPGFDYGKLNDKKSVPESMQFANLFVSAAMRGARRVRWPPTTVFISRARGDKRYGDALAGYLRSSGYEVFLGDDRIRADRMLEASIDEAILQSDLFVALWSTSYAVSRFCNDELELGLQRKELGELHVCIFSLDGTEVVPRAARTVPYAIAESEHALVAAVKEILHPFADD